MTKLPPQAEIEILIRELLQTDAALDVVCERLASHYRENNMTIEALQSLSTFFLYAGQVALLNDFLAHQAALGAKIPWAHFCESIFLSSASVPNVVKKALVKGATAQKQKHELARSQMLDHYDDSLAELRRGRGKFLRDQLLQKHADLEQKIALFKNQGLFEDEIIALKQVVRLFPDDLDAKEQLQRLERQRGAAQMKQIQQTTREHWVPLEAYMQPDAATAESLQAIESSVYEWLRANQDSLSDNGEQMLGDFAMLQIFLENSKAALSLLEHSKENKSHIWLRLEMMLAQRQFLSLLQDIENLQLQWNTDVDDVYGLLYLKAQAFEGLGQTKKGIEILEALLIKRPDYRSAASLLLQWQGVLK